LNWGRQARSGLRRSASAHFCSHGPGRILGRRLRMPLFGSVSTRKVTPMPRGRSYGLPALRSDCQCLPPFQKVSLAPRRRLCPRPQRFRNYGRLMLCFPGVSLLSVTLASHREDLCASFSHFRFAVLCPRYCPRLASSRPCCSTLRYCPNATLDCGVWASQIGFCPIDLGSHRWHLVSKTPSAKESVTGQRESSPSSAQSGQSARLLIQRVAFNAAEMALFPVSTFHGC
jgi:hypothetical protein